MSVKKMVFMAAAAAAAGAGVYWLVKRHAGDVPGLSSWQKVLAQKYGPAKALRIGDQVKLRYAALLAEQPMPGSRTLRGHLAGNILPGLALYQALLQEHGGDQQAALAEVDEALRASTLANSRRLLAPLKLAPDAFGLFKLALNVMMKKFPAEGWTYTTAEKSDERIAMNFSRCFYLNTLTALGAPELTASFCKTDDVMAELFPPSIRFVRPHTLGRGDELCDFEYCHVRQP